MPHQDEELVNRRIAANRDLANHETVVEKRKFLVYPSVFSPEVNSSTGWASSIVPVSVAPKQPGSSMLEIGTGCGAIGILSALAGCPNVICSDINPTAVACAKKNAEIQGVDGVIRFMVSDIYNTIPEGERFDVIFWNFPFNYPTKEESYADLDFCAQSFYDPGYCLLDRYLAEARRFLKPNGSLYLTFSPDTGNVDRFNATTYEHGWIPVLHAFKDVPALAGFTASFHMYRLEDAHSFKKDVQLDESSSIISGS